jgi:hypothetical protein
MTTSVGRGISSRATELFRTTITSWRPDVMRGPNSEYSRARIPSSLEVAHPFVAPKR